MMQRSAPVVANPIVSKAIVPESYRLDFIFMRMKTREAVHLSSGWHGGCDPLRAWPPSEDRELYARKARWQSQSEFCASLEIDGW